MTLYEIIDTELVPIDKFTSAQAAGHVVAQRLGVEFTSLTVKGDDELKALRFMNSDGTLYNYMLK